MMTIKPMKCIVLQAENDNGDYIANVVPYDAARSHIVDVKSFALRAAQYFYPEEKLYAVSVVINDTATSHKVTFYRLNVENYVSFNITWFLPWVPRNMLAELSKVTN
jgi:hypothetical protein